MSIVTSNLPVWQQLGDHARRVVASPLTALCDEPNRFARMCHCAAGITLDLSKQRIDAAGFDGLLALARVAGLPASMAALMRGDAVNTTEGRPALHTALRATGGDALVTNTVMPERTRMLQLAEDIRSGAWRGHTGKSIEDVVHIGIGGSHLGPELATRALPARWPAPRIHFLANVDGALASSILARVNPESTLFIIASKSFSTIESRVNAQTARTWFIERTGALDAFHRHAIAITSNRAAAAEFGIDAKHTLSMWDWVGGRNSIWSSVGLPVAIHIGADGFRELLGGAHEMDQHALSAPIERNLPMLLALTGIWNYNFLGAQSHAVLPYVHALRHLPDYLQQLEMESNGKSVRSDGSRVDVQTVPVLWGGEGTNGQHAFHQFLHQGTRAFSVDFIAAIDAQHTLHEHHTWLTANCLAQSEALLQGSSPPASDALAAHRAMTGSRGSTTILLDRLSPATLGALIALYEHKVYCQGMIWGINPFDQWGVELGKTIGETLFRAIKGGPVNTLSTLTRQLLEKFKRR